MTAQCQACVLSIPLIQTGVGNAREPMGVCVKCHCLACGHHGHRDRSGSYLCIQCDSHLQASSATWNSWVLGEGSGPSGGGQATPFVPDGGGELGAELRSAFAVPALVPLVVDGIDDWLARRPQYRVLIDLIRQDLDRMVAWLDEIAENVDATPRGRSPSAPRPGEVRRREFVELWRRMDGRGRYLLAAALLVAQIMNLPAWSLPAALRDIAEIAGIILREEFPIELGEIPFEEYRYR